MTALTLAEPRRRVTLSGTAVGIVVVVLAAAPWLVNAYQVSLLSRILVLGLLAMSVNLLTGVAGLPTLGQAAYFGVGAYAAALLGRALAPIGVLQLVLAGVLGAIAALVTGAAVIRTRGVTFIMITLAIGELAYTTAVIRKDITGGTDGLSTAAVSPVWGMAPLTNDGLVYYYVLAAFLVLFTLIGVLVRSPFGLALRGIRDNEARLRASGYPVNGYLLAAYTVAGAIAGAAGALWIAVERYVGPGDVGFGVSAMVLIAVILGGTGSMWGALFGTAVVVVVRDYVGNKLSGDLVGHGALLLGAVLVLAVYLFPRGLAGVGRSLGGRRLGGRRRHAPEQPG